MKNIYCISHTSSTYSSMNFDKFILYEFVAFVCYVNMRETFQSFTRIIQNIQIDFVRVDFLTFVLFNIKYMFTFPSCDILNSRSIKILIYLRLSLRE